MQQRGKAWDDLVAGLQLLRKGATDDLSPTHCEHDELIIIASPHAFTVDELGQLEEWGFLSYDNETFHSFRFGSA